MADPMKVAQILRDKLGATYRTRAVEADADVEAVEGDLTSEVADNLSDRSKTALTKFKDRRGKRSEANWDMADAIGEAAALYAKEHNIVLPEVAEAAPENAT